MVLLWSQTTDSRVFGSGAHLLPDHPEFPSLATLIPQYKALRSIIRVRTGRIADSCGFGVPEMDLIGQRSNMAAWAERKTPAELHTYMRDNNTVSIDGLPAWEG